MRYWSAEEARQEIARELGLGSLDFVCPTCARRACPDHCRWCGQDNDAVVRHTESCPRVTGVYEVTSAALVCSRCSAPTAESPHGYIAAGTGPIEELCVGCAAMEVCGG